MTEGVGERRRGRSARRVTVGIDDGAITLWPPSPRTTLELARPRNFDEIMSILMRYRVQKRKKVEGKVGFFVLECCV